MDKRVKFASAASLLSVLVMVCGLLMNAGCGRAGSAASPAKIEFHATDITGADWGQDFRLLDPAGNLRTLADFRGKVVALFFGYTHCPDVCPTTLSDFAAALRQLGPEASKIQVLFVTVDPERDTAEILSRYVPYFNPTFLGMRPPPGELPQLAKTFKVVYQKNTIRSATDYLVDHSAGTYVFDAKGKLRLFVAYGSSAKLIAEDLHTLIQSTE